MKTFSNYEWKKLYPRHALPMQSPPSMRSSSIKVIISCPTFHYHSYPAQLFVTISCPGHLHPSSSILYMHFLFQQMWRNIISSQQSLSPQYPCSPPPMQSSLLAITGAFRPLEECGFIPWAFGFSETDREYRWRQGGCGDGRNARTLETFHRRNHPVSNHLSSWLVFAILIVVLVLFL